MNAKKIVLMLATGLALSVPVYAEEAAMTCDDGTIAKLSVELDKVVDPRLKEKVDAARAELSNASTALKGNKTEDCIAALKKTVDAMPGKPTM